MIQTRYITIDEFKEYYVDKDLLVLFGTEESALAFLNRLEIRMESFINAHFNRNIELEYPTFTDYMKKCYKYALLEQAIYIIKNGDISVDSGLDYDKGEIYSNYVISEKSIAPNAKDQLVNCGIWNRNLNSNRRGFGWWWIR